MIRTRVLVLVLIIATASTGCSLAGRTLGMYVDDQTLTAAVKMGLARKDPRMVMRVNVDTFEGTVYLSGDVASALQKSDAEIAAWEVEGVSQVVNDLSVGGRSAAGAVSASPVIRPASPLLDRLPGIAHVDEGTGGAAGALAYDKAGAVVATVYVRAVRDLAQTGFDALGPTARPITHVSVYGAPAEAPGAPEALMYIVFWHVSAADAAALR